MDVAVAGAVVASGGALLVPISAGYAGVAAAGGGLAILSGTALKAGY